MKGGDLILLSAFALMLTVVVLLLVNHKPKKKRSDRISLAWLQYLGRDRE